MDNFVILTDSCCDLPQSTIINRNIGYATLTFQLTGKEYPDDFGQSLCHTDFYQAMKEGHVIKTSQAIPQEFYNLFLGFVQKGIEILYIGVSSGLSGTYNSANLAKKMILDQYPAAKITLLNSLTGSMGEGLLVLKALEMQQQGKSIQDIKTCLKKSIKAFKTFMTVNDLDYLRKGGRINTLQYALGSLLKINTMLCLDQEGKVGILDKVRGRKRAIQHLVQSVKENIINPTEQTIAISHGNCLEDALLLKAELLKEVKVRAIQLGIIGPVVGAYGGPGALAVFLPNEI
ncbi:DegV family protein [Desulforamulus aeronauticus]|uniref:EDD domain protein, DegV family n=1 Tax=Desulforamulus aeronauticus DSM 10349 TaxID=1121421 RepID=A0A1M6QSX5_9FIRM|nr:DegV family protein [Desulforamulus aeronauticus]SHK23419.1 EDD domain protein, DegV family [Desulforamulus aeronauticus DSM 10349]